MRLLLITNIYPNPYQATKGVFNRELVRTLAAQGHEVRVICPMAWAEEWQARLALGAARLEQRRAVLDGVEVRYPRYYYPPKVLRGQYGRFLWHSVRGTVRSILEEHRPEAVVGYWAHPDGEVAVRAARRAGVPALVMVGGSDVLLLTRQPGRRRQVLRVLHAADAVVAVGQDLRSKLLEFGIPDSKIQVVPRGVDPERFHPGDRFEARRRLGLSADVPVLLWVGRMVPVKGLDVLLRACERLRDQGLEFQVVLVGDGPSRRSLEAQAEASGLRGRVRFVGALAHEQLPDWYRAADWTVLPSRSEGIPNVLRESLACGTRFLASHVGGIPELAEPTFDRLVPPDDPEALAHAIAQGLRDPPQGSAPSIASSWADSGRALIQIIETLLPVNTVSIT